MGNVVFADTDVIGFGFCPGQIIFVGFEAALLNIAPGFEQQFGEKGKMI